ncbi:MAG TPA: hypothetical protein VMR31_09965 [Myxococcota bacterium]|nr:hypothetical protein [Myxococcota bacterium]
MGKRTRDRVELETPAELREILRARGVSDALIARALAAGLAPGQLVGWSYWRKLDTADVEQLVSWHERWTVGDLRGREVTEADAAAFCELWENSPEELGDVEITVLRGPDAFAQFRLQSDVHMHVLADGNVIVASCGWARRKVEIAGQRVSVSYGQALRVHKNYRRMGLGDAVRCISRAMTTSGPDIGQYDIMRSGNFAVVGWWEKHVPGFFENTPRRENEVPGLPVTVAQLPARSAGGANPRVRPARRDDLAVCTALLNRTHGGLDLFRPYTEERLEEVLDEGYWGPRSAWFPAVYGWPDYFVLESGGRVRACAGLWDRGRDLRERIRNRKTGAERTLAGASLLDWGFEAGAESGMAELVAELAGRTAALGRDFLSVSLDHQPELAKSLEAREPAVETRYLRWGNRDLPIVRPYTDLRYW